PVVALVVAGAVLVVLAIGLVVLLAVARPVRQRESIVRRDEVDRRPRPAALVIEHVRRALQARRQRAALARIAAPEAAHVIAVAIVPLGHARRMVAQLVAARAAVPGLGDQLGLREQRVLHQRIEEARTLLETLRLATQ